MSNEKANIQMIAEKANVHPSTVSLALRGSDRISESTREKIKQIAREVNYRPNFMAKGLRGEKPRSIGVLIPKLRDLYVVDVMAAQERLLQQRDYCSLMAVTHMNEDFELKTIESLLGRGVDGLVFNYVPESEKVVKYLGGLLDSGVPVFFLGKSPLEGAG